MTHPVLTQVTPERVFAEIADSKTKIERELGEKVRVFLYPHGDCNKRVAEQVKRAGYDCAFTVNSGTNRVGDNLFELGRRICP